MACGGFKICQNQQVEYTGDISQDNKRRQELEQLDKAEIIEGYLLLEKRGATLVRVDGQNQWQWAYYVIRPSRAAQVVTDVMAEDCQWAHQMQTLLRRAIHLHNRRDELTDRRFDSFTQACLSKLDKLLATAPLAEDS